MFICIQEYCSGEEVAPRAEKDGPSCEWEEYEQTGEYINKIDEIIQVNRRALLGFQGTSRTLVDFNLKLFLFFFHFFSRGIWKFEIFFKANFLNSYHP